jgi:hypothetical protein
MMLDDAGCDNHRVTSFEQATVNRQDAVLHLERRVQHPASPMDFLKYGH